MLRQNMYKEEIVIIKYSDTKPCERAQPVSKCFLRFAHDYLMNILVGMCLQQISSFNY